MSALLLANGPFLSILLNTTNKQQINLLKSLTPSQEKVVLEILQNINRLPHTRDDDVFLKNKRAFLKRVEKNRQTKGGRKNIFRNLKIILQILNYFSGKLLSLF